MVLPLQSRNSNLNTTDRGSAPRTGSARGRFSRMLGDGFSMPRLDRFLTLRCTYPLKRLFASKDSGRVPILMYHSVSDNLFGKKHPYYQINTSPHMFAKQMKWLHESGYQTLTLAQLHSAIENATVPAKTVEHM